MMQRWKIGKGKNHWFQEQLDRNMKWILKIFLLSYLVYSQIWLNLFANDHQFGYFRRWKKKNTPACLPSSSS
jgi:hypothetical protein